MVFVAIWPAGRSDLVILPSGFKTNSATWIKNCLKPLLTYLPPYQNLKKIIFHQDHAPAHRVRNTQPFLEEVLPLFVRADETPPNSPAPNPLDYIVAFTMMWPAVFRFSFCEDAKHLSQTLSKIFFLDLTQNPTLDWLNNSTSAVVPIKSCCFWWRHEAWLIGVDFNARDEPQPAMPYIWLDQKFARFIVQLYC